jgi:probable F420-dependent oxidoreductase
VEFGLAIFPTEDSPPPGELARRAEESGFDAFYVTEHTHIPASRETPYPAGGDLPREYSRIYDPLISLTQAAARTERIRLCTGLLLIVERDPITTAKEVATLDLLSGGRVELGVGAGWNLEEMRNHGTDPERRFGIMRERVEAMKQIWTSEEASYDGRYVSFDRIWSWPKPVQKPHPPVIVGGNGKTVYDRVVAFGDGWIPNYLGDVEKLAARIEKLHGLAADAGREPPQVMVYGSPRDPAAIDRFAEAGVKRCVFWLPPTVPGDLQERFDKCAKTVADYRGQTGE